MLTQTAQDLTCPKDPINAYWLGLYTMLSIVRSPVLVTFLLRFISGRKWNTSICRHLLAGVYLERLSEFYMNVRAEIVL